MDYEEFKRQLKEMHGKIKSDTRLSEQESNDLRAAIIMLIMHTNHRIADGV